MSIERTQMAPGVGTMPHTSRVATATVTAFKDSVQRHIRYSLAKSQSNLSGNDWFRAFALAVRDLLVERMLETEARYEQADAKRLYYLSLEFLMGRALGNNLNNLGISELCRAAADEIGVNLEAVRGTEWDAALGNGGLGRLAACFLDSLASLDMPGYGYGIRYDYGLFRQEIDGGHQREKPDNWLTEPSPWLIERPEEACVVPVYGRVTGGPTEPGHRHRAWNDWRVIVGVPHDMPVVGYGGHTVNFLRLYSARASDEFDIAIFNDGDYFRAVEQKITSENISKVLYPSDAVAAGRELRLLQEYFFVACALRDIVRRHLHRYGAISDLPSRVAIQLNDTHPALAVPELMRTLIDEHALPFDMAWEITQATFGYTNHTLLPEGLEQWPVALIERVIPRHLQLIYEINRRLLDHVARVWPGDTERLRRVSLIEEGAERRVRTAHLAIAGSHSVNGVAALHSKLITTRLVPDFFALWPERFNNKTNGVTQRRWLLTANPGLARLITDTIGDRWITDLDQLRDLEPHARDAAFRHDFLAAKQANKEHLAAVIKATTQVTVDPRSLFDVQAKRIHEYKRQLLAVMGIIDTYLALVEDGTVPPVPRTHIFAGKAAPGYWAAKQIIKLIHNLGGVINADPVAKAHLNVVFIPDYRVTLAEQIIPAADLSEQISMAGTEASGTGNMKFAMNGALTIGTLDGANIEIRDEVGKDNIFIFGLTADAIAAMQRDGSYHPRDYYEHDARLRRVVDALQSDRFCPQEPGLFHWIADTLLQHDAYFHLADFAAYVAAQERVGREFTKSTVWTRKAILNVARIGKFSSDRTIREYAAEIWDIHSV
jgi:starch phosphorylase